MVSQKDLEEIGLLKEKLDSMLDNPKIEKAIQKIKEGDLNPKYQRIIESAISGVFEEEDPQENLLDKIHALEKQLSKAQEGLEIIVSTKPSAKNCVLIAEEALIKSSSSRKWKK